MARLTKEARAAMPHDKAHFLNPSKAPGPGSYPVPDAEHRAVAKGLAAMHGNKAMEAKADKAIKAHSGGKTLGSGTHGFTHGHNRKMC